MEEQQIGHLHARTPGDKVHFCVCCTFPIAVYGRLYPCLHTYCLACATDMDKCYICTAPILRIERIPCEQGLYISSTTLQSFKSAQELEAHTKRAYQHLMSSPAVLEAKAAKSQPQPFQTMQAAMPMAGVQMMPPIQQQGMQMQHMPAAYQPFGQDRGHF